MSNNTNRKKQARSTPATQPGAVAVTVEESSRHESNDSATVISSAAKRNNKSSVTSTARATTKPGAGTGLLADATTTGTGTGTIGPGEEMVTSNAPTYSSNMESSQSRKKRTKAATMPGAVTVSKGEVSPNAPIGPASADTVLSNTPTSLPNMGTFLVSKKKRTKAATMPGAVTVAKDSGKIRSDVLEEGIAALPVLLSQHAAEGTLAAPHDLLAARHTNAAPKGRNRFKQKGNQEVIITAAPPTSSGDNSATAPKGRNRFKQRGNKTDDDNIAAPLTLLDGETTTAPKGRVRFKQKGNKSDFPLVTEDVSIDVAGPTIMDRSQQMVCKEDLSTESCRSKNASKASDREVKNSGIILSSSALVASVATTSVIASSNPIPQTQIVVPGAIRHSMSGTTTDMMPSSDDFYIDDYDHDASPRKSSTPPPLNADFIVVDMNDGGKKPMGDKPLCSRTRWIMLAVIVLLIVVGGAVGGVLSGSSSESEGNEGRGPTPTALPPTLPPVPAVAPTVSSGELKRWVDVLTTASPNTSFEDPIAASSLALEWMRSDPYSADLEDDLLLQRFALVTLWYSTNGPKWLISPTWLDTGGSECDWEGVFSCSVDGFVLDVSLSKPGAVRSFNLAGPIPIELGLLSSLESLDLTQNDLVGTVPTELAQLTSAHSLRLGENSLNGTIPTEFGNLSLLTSLFLSFNRLVGVIPTELIQLAALEEIALDSNFLEGPILIGPWSKLRALGLAVNQLTGTIPTEIGTLTSLQILLLGYNNYERGLVRMPSELGQLTLLKSVFLQKASLSFPIPMEIGALAAIKTIDLGDNQLSGAIPAEFGNLTALLTVNLASNELTGPIPVELGALTLLQELLLGSNFLNGSMPQAICDNGLIPLVDCLEVECSCCKGVSVSGSSC